MNIIRTLIVIGIAGTAYAYWNHHRDSLTQLDAGAAVNERGFATLPPVDGQNSGTVFVVAAQNCPHEDAQRADRLAEDISREGIPVQRVNTVNFSFLSAPDNSTMERIDQVMTGPLPIVFVAGRAKSNPSLEEVVAEFKGG